MPIDPRILDAWEDAKNVCRKLFSVVFGIPDTDYIAELRARLTTPERNMRIDAKTYNRLSDDIQDGTRAAEILITNTQDVTPERLEQLPRSMQDAARVLLAGSKTLEAVKEKSKRHEQELKKIEKEAREEKRRQIDEDVENIAALRAEEIAKPYAEHLARKMTAKAAKDIELSEGMKARIKLIGWKNDFEEGTSLQRDRIWGDRFLEKQKQFTKEETERIEEENKAIWDEYAKQWLEQAEAEKKQEMQRLKDDYVAVEKRKRDETEAELWDQVDNLTDKVDHQGRKIKKLKTRLNLCQCGTGSESDSPDSDGEESDDGGSDNGGSDHGGGNDAGNGPGKPPKHPGPGPGGSEVNRDNTLSKAPPLSSGKSGQGGTGGPPTGPRKITDDRDKNPHGSGSRNPPSNTHNQDRKPSSGSGTTPASNGSKPNPFENAERRPPGGWSEENEKRKPLSDNPFEEAQARMLEQMRKNAAPAPNNQNKPPPKFGQTSGPPRPGQFGAPSNPGAQGNPVTKPPAVDGRAPNPRPFGSDSRTMNLGLYPAGTGGNPPANPTTTDGSLKPPFFDWGKSYKPPPPFDPNASPFPNGTSKPVEWPPKNWPGEW